MAKESEVRVPITSKWDGKGTKDAVKDLDGLKKKVGEAEGAGGKLKAGLGGAFDMVGTSAGAMAATGVGAVAALGAAAVMQFRDGAIEADKLASTMGTTTENASRLNAVFKEQGIELGDTQDVMNNLSGLVSENDAIFEQLGGTIAKNADGTTDMNETFLRTVEALKKIKDPAEKAAAMAKLFGEEGARQFGPLVDTADELREKLEGVSDAQVFNKKEVEQGKKLDAAFKEIMSSGRDLMLTLGQALAPVIAELAPTLGDIVEAAGPLAQSLGELLVSAIEILKPVIEGLLPVINAVATALGTLSDAVGKVASLVGDSASEKAFEAWLDNMSALKDKAIEAGMSEDAFNESLRRTQEQMPKTGDQIIDLQAHTDLMTEAIDGATSASTSLSDEAKMMSEATRQAAPKIDVATDAVDEMERAQRRAEDAMSDVRAEWLKLTGALSAEAALLNLEQQFDDVAQAAIDNAQAVKDGQMTQEQATRNNALAVNQLKQDVVSYGDSILNLPPSRVTELLAQIDQGNLAAVESKLQHAARDRAATFTMTFKGVSTGGGGKAFSSGGYTGPGPTDEVAGIVHKGEYVVPKQHVDQATGLPKSVAGSGSTTVNNNNLHVHYAKLDERSLLEALRNLQRQGKTRVHVV